MMKRLTASALAALLLAGSSLAAYAAGEINLRATANSNENDEDYDGLVVFKNYVEQASNGAISVELFIGTQLCSNGTDCLAGPGGRQYRHCHSDFGRNGKHLSLRPGSGPSISDE